MATHDYVLANASGAAFRADLNNALAAIVSNNSSTTEPATTYAYMWWADTNAGQLKLRNAANDDWVVIQELDGTLLMEDGTVGAPGLAFASDLDTGFYRPAADELGIVTGGTNAIYIDSSGRLLVGTSTARNTFGGGSESFRMQLEGDSFENAGLSIARNSNDSGTPSITFGKTRSTGNTIVQNDDPIGTLLFEGNDGTNFVRGASIAAEVDGTPGANDMPGRLVFSTTADGASSPTERMRITNEGYVYFNTTASPSSSGYGSGFLQVGSTGSRRTALYQRSEGTSASSVQAFYNPNGLVGSISVSGSATAFNTSSDYRLKENVVPLTGAADRLNQLQVHRFNFIADPNKTVDGFLAHEAQSVVPECVTGTKDEVDDEGNPVYQGIDQSKLVPLLTAALQEALAEIESLKARVTALEP